MLNLHILPNILERKKCQGRKVSGETSGEERVIIQRRQGSIGGKSYYHS